MVTPLSRKDKIKWSISISAWVVELQLIAPYWRGLILYWIVSFIHSHVKDSSALLNTGVRDMGRKWESTSVGGVFFGRGTTSAVFQSSGRPPSRRELLNIAQMGPAKYGAKSRKTHAGIPSHPVALLTLSLTSLRSTSSGRITHLSGR